MAAKVASSLKLACLGFVVNEQADEKENDTYALNCQTCNDPVHAGAGQLERR